MKPRSASSLTTQWIRPYGMAVASVATAVALALFAEHQGQKNLEVPLLMMAIAITVWYAGLAPAALAIVVSTLSFDYLFTEPRYSFSIHSTEIASFLVFVAFAVLIGWFVARRRQIEQDLRIARDELEAEVAVRTQQR